MVMSKHGQVILYSLMLASLLLVLVLSLSPIVKTFTEQTRSDMNCSAQSTLSEYDQATCYGWDIVLFMFVVGGIAVVFIVIGAKIIGG